MVGKAKNWFSGLTVGKKIVSVVAGVLLLSAIGSSSNQPTPTSPGVVESVTTNSVVKKSEEKPKPKPICDGTNVKNSCELDGIKYVSYVYHPAIPEKSHSETVTTYKQQVTGYCTLCVDGTYSPSCATGSGACSHHGGVAQWNAPKYSNVPEHTTKQVIDAPAQAAYYEKVAE